MNIVFKYHVAAELEKPSMAKPVAHGKTTYRVVPAIVILELCTAAESGSRGFEIDQLCPHFLSKGTSDHDC